MRMLLLSFEDEEDADVGCDCWLVRMLILLRMAILALSMPFAIQGAMRNLLQRGVCYALACAVAASGRCSQLAGAAAASA